MLPQERPRTGSRASRVEPLVVGGETVPPGATREFELPAALLPTHTRVSLPVVAMNGTLPGPRMWLSAAIHGDELNGVEIIRRVIEDLGAGVRRGALVAVPIVNVFGFLQQSRYLPDRRDLNRSFPGSSRGSLASRLARLFIEEVVSSSTHGIDLHTAAKDRSNYPQVRANLDDPETDRCADAFGAPVKVHSDERKGSLRATASKMGITALVYEGGEAMRFNEEAISVGVRGVLGVMSELGMTARRRGKRNVPLRVLDSSWVRARRGGLVRELAAEGQRVHANQVIGILSDPLGSEASRIRAPFDGVVLGRARNPIVYAGDAVLHVGKIASPSP